MNEYMEQIHKYIASMGHAKPGDLEDRFCGEQTLYARMFDPLGAWWRSPYPQHLTTLLYCGFVGWWINDDQEVCYAALRPMRFE